MASQQWLDDKRRAMQEAILYGYGPVGGWDAVPLTPAAALHHYVA